MDTVETTLGDWIAELFEAWLEELGDTELASLATAATVQERLAAQQRPPAVAFEAA